MSQGDLPRFVTIIQIQLFYQTVSFAILDLWFLYLISPFYYDSSDFNLLSLILILILFVLTYMCQKGFSTINHGDWKSKLMAFPGLTVEFILGLMMLKIFYRDFNNSILIPGDLLILGYLFTILSSLSLLYLLLYGDRRLLAMDFKK